ncbi:MAG: pitrilysin family protein [Chloroflexi bacterium]|nr:pitrilysin family protein [Chloroflexota bacterium]MDA1146765.1 pitrilysin family protein [Chloroflexota bacterium]
MAQGWQLTTLDNGLRVLTTTVPTAQSAAAAFFVRVGSRNEDPRTNGLSHYIEHMLFKGTTERPEATQISQAIEGAGGSLNAYTTKELTCYWNNLPYERAETGIEILGDMLQHSLLETVEIDRERTVVQQEIKRAHDNPGAFVGELLGRAVYGDQPIGWPVAGSVESVEEMHRPDFAEHMTGYYTADNSVLSVSGNVEHQQVVEWATARFSDLPVGKPAAPVASKTERPEAYIQLDPRELEQTNVALSMHGMARNDPDRYAFDLMNTALGRGMSSRLFQEVRERRGLAYSVSAGGARYSDTGSLTVSAGVTREHQEEALEVILAELRKLVDEPMGDEELQRTKDYAAGSFRLSLETPMALGQRYGNQLLMDGEIESPEDSVTALRAVTAADIQAVAKRVIGPGEFSIAVVGPTAEADRLDALLHG